MEEEKGREAERHLWGGDSWGVGGFVKTAGNDSGDEFVKKVNAVKGKGNRLCKASCRQGKKNKFCGQGKKR